VGKSPIYTSSRQKARYTTTMKLPQLQAEYRGAQVRSYDYVDKVSGQRKTGVSAQLQLEAADDTGVLQIQANFPLPVGATTEVATTLVTSKFKRGTSYLFSFRSFEISKGSANASVADAIPVK